MPLGPRVFFISGSSRMNLKLAFEMLTFVSVGFSILISSILRSSLAENTELKKVLKRRACFELYLQFCRRTPFQIESLSPLLDL